MRSPCVLFVLSFLAFAVPASAQNTVLIGQVVSIAADHNGVNAVGYRLYQNDAVTATLPVSARANGAITFQNVTFTARGDQTVVVSAFNADREDKSPPLTVTVQQPSPGAPSLPRLIVTVALGPSGELEWKLMAVRDDGTVGPWDAAPYLAQ